MIILLSAMQRRISSHSIHHVEVIYQKHPKHQYPKIQKIADAKLGTINRPAPESEETEFALGVPVADAVEDIELESVWSWS